MRFKQMLGMAFGIAIGIAFCAFEDVISPRAETLLGDSWSWIKPLLFLLFLGAVCKATLLRQISRSYRIEPMTPQEFAGLSLEQMQQPARMAPPLPSVVPDESNVAPAKPSGALDLDWAQMERRTRELLELGFALQVEGAVRTDRKASIPTFVRVFADPEGANAQVFQWFPLGRAPMPVAISLTTYFEDDWLVGDSTMKGNWATWMMRRARAVGKGYEETTPTATMWQTHRARCERVANELGVRVTPFSLDNYVELAEIELRAVRALVLRRSILVAMLQSRFFRPPDGEWWGDFERAARSRKQQGGATAIAKNG